MIAQTNPDAVKYPTKYVIWGLGNTLKKNSAETQAVFPRQCLKTAFSLAKKTCDETSAEFQKLAEKAAKKYATERRMTQFVARKFGLNEEILFQQYYSDLVTTESLLGHHDEKLIVDQGILNAFQKSVDEDAVIAGEPLIEHRLLTNVSTFNAIFWLNRMGIKPFFSQIVGLDAVTSIADGKRLNLKDKAQNPDAVHRIMHGIPQNRYNDVIVIDNDLKFLNLFKRLYPQVQTYECRQFEGKAKKGGSSRYIPGHQVADKVSTFMNEILSVPAYIRTGPYKPKKA